MRRLIAIAAVAVCLTGCSSPKESPMEISQKRIDEVNARIDKSVADSVRSQALKDVVATLDRQLQAHTTSLQEKRDAIVDASADYTTTRQDLEALYAGVSTETRAIMTLLKETHVAMTQQTTPDEWAAITRGKKRLFELN